MAWILLSFVQTTREKFENAAYLYSWVNLPPNSREIVQRKRNFSKMLSKPEELKTLAVRSSAEEKHFENGAFLKR